MQGDLVPDGDVIQDFELDEFVLLHDPAGAFLALFQPFNDNNAHAVAFFMNHKIDAHGASNFCAARRPRDSAGYSHIRTGRMEDLPAALITLPILHKCPAVFP